jgi:5-formyltetrahydrofolate cyclo-ligase
MRFVEAVGPLRRNRLGILEPASARPLSARWLDVVFVPLVGFDPSGMRLGMGAGYYDRAFAHRRVRTTWCKPRLIGLAYALQRVASLTPAEHDVRLDAIITEQEVLRCRIGC